MGVTHAHHHLDPLGVGEVLLGLSQLGWQNGLWSVLALESVQSMLALACRRKALWCWGFGGPGWNPGPGPGGPGHPRGPRCRAVPARPSQAFRVAISEVFVHLFLLSLVVRPEK